MIALMLGLAAALLILWRAREIHDTTSRLATLRSLTPARTGGRKQSVVIKSFESLGRRAGRVPLLRKRAMSRPVAIAAGASIVVCPAVFVASPPVAALLAGAAIGGTVFAERRRRLRWEREIERQMPVVVELLVLAVQGGLNISMAFSFVAERVEGPVSGVFALVLRDTARGMRFVDALQRSAGRLGRTGTALVSILLAGERYGSSLQDTLVQLASESRFDQERQADEAARRLSVQLLFPVAGCMLPAFALLTIAPLLAGSLGTLASSFQK